MNQETKNKLIDLHDQAKHHLYWTSFDTKLFRDLDDVYNEMIKTLSEDCGALFSHDGTIYYKSKYGAVAMSMVHGLRSKMCYESVLDRGSKEFSNLIMMMQNFLMIVHQCIDDKGEPCYPTEVNSKVKFRSMIKSEYKEDGEYKGWVKICEVKKEDKEKVIELYEHLRDKSKHAKEFFDKYIEDLKNGKNDYYRFI